MLSTRRRLTVFWKKAVDTRNRLPTQIELARMGFRFLEIAFKGIGWLTALGVLEYVTERQHSIVLHIVVLVLGYILGMSSLFYLPVVSDVVVEILAPMRV